MLNFGVGSMGATGLPSTYGWVALRDFEGFILTDFEGNPLMGVN